MTMRERMLAVLRGEEHDRVPFVQYSGLAAPDEEVWSVVGRENMGVVRWTRVHRVEHPNCRTESESAEIDGRPGERTVLHTPAGTLTEEKHFEPTYGTGSRSKYFIRKRADWEVFNAYLRDAVVTEDLEPYVRADAECGDDGVPMVSVERTPYQQLWIQWTSLEHLVCAMVDWPDVVEECMTLLADIERRILRVVRRTHEQLSFPMVNIPDNITAPAIGPKYFREWCVPLYNELADIMAERDVPVFVHMDGDPMPLSDDIAASGISGLDSFSPEPDNDTSVADAVRLWPEKRLWLNFPSSVHIAEAPVIRERAELILEQAGHSGRLQIQISENVPPGMWRRSFPEIVGAIREFGSP